MLKMANTEPNCMVAIEILKFGPVGCQRRINASEDLPCKAIFIHPGFQALDKFYPNLNDVCFSRSIPSGVSDLRLFFPSPAFSRMLPTCAGKSRNPAYCRLMLMIRPSFFLMKLHRYRPPDYRCYDCYRRPQWVVVPEP